MNELDWNEKEHGGYVFCLQCGWSIEDDDMTPDYRSWFLGIRRSFDGIAIPPDTPRPSRLYNDDPQPE